MEWEKQKKKGRSMTKYLLSGLSGVALLLLVSGPVSAFSMPSFPYHLSGPQIENEADVENDVVVNANTGGNIQTTSGMVSLFSGGTGSVVGLNEMLTGNAGSGAVIQNMANIGDDCGCTPGAEVENEADIENDVEVNANSGGNVQVTGGSVGIRPMVMTQSFGYRHGTPTAPTGTGSVTGGNLLQTGNAVSTAEIWNLVNSSYVMSQ